MSQTDDILGGHPSVTFRTEDSEHVDTTSVDLNRRIDVKIVKEAAIKDGDSLFSFTATKTSSSSWQRIYSTTGESNVHTAIQ